MITIDVHNENDYIFAPFFFIYAYAWICKAILLYIKIIYSIFLCFNIESIFPVPRSVQMQVHQNVNDLSIHLCTCIKNKETFHKTD